jgi:hypothetical protein
MRAEWMVPISVVNVVAKRDFWSEKYAVVLKVS